MPVAITHEQRALQESVRRWAGAAETLSAVRAAEPGTPMRPDGHRGQQPGHWADLAALGLFAIALPEPCGGAGGSVLDLAAAVEAVTDVLAPGPILPTLLAGLVLAGHRDDPLIKELLPALAAGEATVAVGLPPGGLAATPALGAPDAVGLHGRVGPVLGAGDTTHLLLPVGGAWGLVDSDHPGVRVADRPPVDFSRRLGDVYADDAVLPAERLLGLSDAAVTDTAALLGSVEAAAVARWSLRTATEYATVRRQFGRPIGSYQAVKHLCAQMLCRAERAEALAWDAARAFDTAPEEFPLAVAAAAAVALDAGVDNAKDCVQVLGGIGFTWEHDVHLYLRRAVALRQLLGGAGRWRRRTAELARGGARRTVRSSAEVAAPEPVRRTVAEIAALSPDRRRAALADTGLLTPHWPAPYGRDATPGEQLAIDAELVRAGVARPDLGIAAWAVPAILRHGTDAQRERFVTASLRGELHWCQLFSEPEAGSDLAALRTRATAVPGGWVLSGQKVWTSLAHRAQWGICLARTHPERPKHRGITYFLVRMDSPGIEIRPLREITGECRFNEVFLDEVFVPDDCVVGEPGDGWKLARSTLADERVAIGGGSALGQAVERLLEAGAIDDDALGALAADGLALSAVELRAALRRLDGDRADAESAVAKLLGVAHRQTVAEAALVAYGPDGAAADAAQEAVHEFLLTRCLSIAGGTTQILLTLVAERVLGLPREEGRQ